jgi:hypothetical protein
MCSAAFDGGPEEMPAAIFARAEARFTEALTAAQASGNTTFLRMAQLGRARTRMRLQRYADAESDAAAVPAGFVAYANYATSPVRRQNFVYSANQASVNVSVEGVYRNFRTAGQLDPRVGVFDTGRTATPASPIRLWHQLKYSEFDTRIPIATSDEARLIVAEAKARAGDLQGAVDIITALHAAVGLPPFASGDRTLILQQIVWERSAELFLESHHLGDLRQYNVPLDPPAGTPFAFGGVYGAQTCFPLPDAERFNNPNIG